MIDKLIQTSYQKNSLPFRIERFEGLDAILVFESVDETDQQELKWPIRQLPDKAKLGQKVWLQLSNNETRALEKEEILRKLLEEIIT
ncbi:MAG: hypothetical protein NTZ80_00535 [Patescibacteria group bacterium]|nr:hypothetical protein [Patescibacteria group bacterium]